MNGNFIRLSVVKKEILKMSKFDFHCINAASSIDFLPINPAQWAPWLILTGLTFTLFILSSILCKKTGLHSSKATICLIPIIGPFIFFWTLAFSPWPIGRYVRARD